MGDVMDAVVLDRKKLDRNDFWREFKTAARASRPVEIRTGGKEWKELPSDIKLLYYRAERQGKIGPLGGVTGLGLFLPPPIIIIILKWIVVSAVIALAIVFVSNKYKFTVKVGPDGTIEIEGEPA